MADPNSRRLTNDWFARQPLVAALVHLLLVHLVAGLTVWRSPGRDTMRPQGNGLRRYLISPLTVWDGAWYERIARDGYGLKRITGAFWPLYPWLTGTTSKLTGLSIPEAGLLISHLAFVGAMLVLYQLVRFDHPDKIASRTVWLVALSPVAFFLSALYSEALFLLLTLLAVTLAKRGNWTFAALALFLATLTRSAGILITIPVAATLLTQFKSDFRKMARPGIQIAAAMTGPFIFAFHLNRLWGDPLLMLHAQSQWNRRFSWPWQSLWHGFRQTELTYITARHTCFDALGDRSWSPCRDALGLRIDSISDDLALLSVLIALILLPIAARKLPPGDSLYAGAVLLFPLFSTTPDSPLLSLPRMLLMAYPLFITAALLVCSRRFFIALLVVQTGGLIWLLSLFARAYFVA